MTLAIVHNSEIAPSGRLVPVLESAGIEWVDLHLGEGDELPDLSSCRGLVLLGGEMGAYDEDRYPYLVEEKEMVREAVAQRTPVLGICLGSQLIADALGGRAYLAPAPEVGLVDVELTPEGTAHPVLGGIGARVLAVHQDTFDLPPGATVLARSASFPQAFEVGTAIGLQFHPEADSERVRAWAEGAPGGVFARVGVDPESLLDELTRADEELASSARGLFRRWIDGALTNGR